MSRFTAGVGCCMKLYSRNGFGLFHGISPSTSVTCRSFKPRSSFIVNPQNISRIQSKDAAFEYLFHLKDSEREFLHDALDDLRNKRKKDDCDDDDASSLAITKEQSKKLFIITTLPFIGFGFLDNFIMIVVGEYIDASMGVYLSLSTMAAAGIGNILSDVAGVGSAHYIETMVSKFGAKMPALTPEQWDSPRTRWIQNFGRCTGLIIGCLIGMFPLLFYDEKKTRQEKMKNQ